MDISISRLFDKQKIVDQVTGLAFGVGIAVLTVVISAVSGATDEELISPSFWLAVVGTGLRSALTAAGTVLGLQIPGVSSR